jgi:hypothetical protein
LSLLSSVELLFDRFSTIAVLPLLAFASLSVDVPSLAIAGIASARLNARTQTEVLSVFCMKDVLLKVPKFNMSCFDTGSTHGATELKQKSSKNGCTNTRSAKRCFN